MTDESSRAQLARLQAELADAKEDRDDTVREHAYETQESAYDKMTENIDESLDNSLRAVEANSELQDQVVNEMLQKVMFNYNTAYNNINDTIFSSGTATTSTANSQIGATNDMLSTIQTSYKDVYDNINGIIGDTGTRISTQAEKTVGDIKNVITQAMKDTQDSIDEWIKKNSALGVDIKTSFIASGNELTQQNIMDTSTKALVDRVDAKAMYDKDMAAMAAKLVNELPDKLKLSDKSKVDEAKKYYDKLTKDQQNYVDWKKLKAALDEIARLEEEQRKAQEKATAEAKAKADAEKKANAASDKRVSDANSALKKQKNATIDTLITDLQKDLDALRAKRDTAMNNIDEAKRKYGSKSKKYETAKANYLKADDAYNARIKKYEDARSIRANVLNANDILNTKQKKLNDVKAQYGTKSTQYEKALNALMVASNNSAEAILKQDKMVGDYYHSKSSTAVKTIIQQGTKRSSKKLTDAEKKSHGALWEYIASKYGYNINNGVISELAQVFGVKLANASKPTTAELNKILKLMKDAGYARGTLGTRKDELNWTHSGEIIRRSDGAILRQLPQGTQVVPKLASENLMRWAQINPTQWMGEMQKVADIPKSNQQQVINPILNYSPTINGSGLNQDQLAMILKKERDDAFRDFSNRLRKDLRMSGR